MACHGLSRIVLSFSLHKNSFPFCHLPESSLRGMPLIQTFGSTSVAFISILVTVLVVTFSLNSHRRRTTHTSTSPYINNTSHVDLLVSTIQPSPLPSSSSSSSQSQKQRVAVCFTGNVRTFVYEFVHESSIEHLLNPLRRNESYAVDTFFNIRIRDESLPDFLQQTNKTELLSTIQDKFSPVLIHELSDADNLRPTKARPQINNTILYPPFNCPGEAQPYIHLPHSLYRHSQCRHHISAHELQTGLKYHYVYVLRPDFWMGESFKLPHDMDNNTLYINMAPESVMRAFRTVWKGDNRFVPSSSDQVLAGTRSVMDIGMRAVEVIDECDIYFLPGEKNPEFVLSYWAMTNGLNITSDPLFMVIMRFQTGLECHVFEQFEFVNESKEEAKLKAMQLVERCSHVVQP